MSRVSGIDDNAMLVANFNYDFADQTGRHVFLHTSSATIDTTTMKFGNGSAKIIPPDSSAITVTDSLSDFVFSGDFTLEAWVRCGSGSSIGIGGHPADSYGGQMIMYVNTSGYAGWGGYGSWDESESTVQIANNTWTYLCVDRYENNMSLSLDGTVLLTREDYDVKKWHSDSAFKIMTDASSGSYSHVDSVRVSNVSRYYASNFSVPTEEFGIFYPDASPQINTARTFLTTLLPTRLFRGFQH